MNDGNNRVQDLTLLLARGALGASIASHGAQKLWGWFGGPGINGAAQFLDSLGFRPGERYARAASVTEIASGVLIAAGALGPVGPGMLASVMTVAVGSVHVKNGFFNSDQGFELNTLYALCGLILAVDGYGAFSLDAATGRGSRANAMWGIAGIAGGILAGLALLNQRQSPAQTTSSSSRGDTNGAVTDGAPEPNVVPQS